MASNRKHHDQKHRAPRRSVLHNHTKEWIFDNLQEGYHGSHLVALCVYNREGYRQSGRTLFGGIYFAAPAESDPDGARGGRKGVGATLALSLAEFNRLVADHGPTLYRTAYRMVGDAHEAEDLVQDAFRSAWKSRRLFRPGGGERAWLVSILRRRVVDHWRRPRPPMVLTSDRTLEVGFSDDDPLRDEFTDEMQQALQRLPKDLRETLLLVVVAELTHQEAADLQQIPLGTVLSRVSRARKRLREYLLAASSNNG